MKLTELLNNKLILTEMEAENNFDVIRQLGSRLVDEGYVKNEFIESVIKREIVYPTGIECLGTNIAIPHTDGSHVIKSGIVMGVFKDGVLFNRMDNEEEKLKVKLVFLLAIKKSDLHCNCLRQIMYMGQNLELIEDICNCKCGIEILNKINKEDL